MTTRPFIHCAGVVDPYLPGGTEGETHTYAPGERLEGLPAEWAPLMHDLGVTMMQIDAPHVTTPEVAEGEWDWSAIDRCTAECRSLGFEVMLFPHWHWPPDWYERKYGLEGIRCLEHDERLPCLSVWDPATLPWFERCIAALAAHYTATHGRLEGLFLGIHGDYGECMFPMSSAAELADRFRFERGGTVSHGHCGYWCGDRFARADFPRCLIEQYGSLDGLNDAWSSRFARAEDVAFPHCGTGPRRPWLDFVTWYRASMTRFSGAVADMYRRHFPDTVLTVPLGGGVEPPEFGQDNTALAKVMQASGTAIRSTANTCLYRSPDLEGRVNKFGRSYAILKRVKGACRLYDMPMWLAPPSRDAFSVTVGIFEALSCGVAGCLDWGRTFERRQEQYRKFKGLLRGVDPRVDTAVYFPIASHFLADKASTYRGNMPARFWDGCTLLRAVCDYDVVDDLLIREGALGHYRRLIVFEADIIERDVVEALASWLHDGGRIIASVGERMETVEGDEAPMRQLLGVGGGRRVTELSESVVLGDDAAFEGVGAADLEALRTGWIGIGGSATPLVTRGDAHVAWRHAAGGGSVIAIADDAAQLPGLVKMIHAAGRAAGDLPGAFDLCRDAQAAESVFVTHFEDGVGVLNLNELPVQISVGERVETVAGSDLAWLAVER